MILYQKENSSSLLNNDIKIYRNFSYIPHFHKDIEFVYVNKGELIIKCYDKEFLAKEGQTALILSNVIHSYECIGENEVTVHVFSLDNVPSFAKLISERDVLTPIFDCDPSVCDFYLNYCIKKKKRSKMALKSVLYAICNDFYEKSEFISAQKENDELLHKILSYISENYREEITLADMAQSLGYDMHYISRVFGKNTNTNIRKHINLYRIDFAKERLINTAAPISQIALESGFQSIRNFNRVFLSYTGITPADYRKYGENTDFEVEYEQL